MTCPKCGFSNNPNDTRCQKCGSTLPLPQQPAPQSHAQPAPQQYAQPAPQQYAQPGPQQYAQPQQVVYASPPKSKGVAFLLCFFFGLFGVHHFYMGNIVIGVIQLLTCGGFGIWCLLDLIIILCGGYTDGEGRLLQ
ncbi:MAG: NINE protein [Opitutae bacterium]